MYDISSRRPHFPAAGHAGSTQAAQSQLTAKGTLSCRELRQIVAELIG